jgi:hypothetical protein
VRQRLAEAHEVDDLEHRRRRPAEPDLCAATACREPEPSEGLDGHGVGGDTRHLAEHHVDLPVAEESASAGIEARQVGAREWSPDLEGERGWPPAAHVGLERAAQASTATLNPP